MLFTSCSIIRSASPSEPKWVRRTRGLAPVVEEMICTSVCSSSQATCPLPGTVLNDRRETYMPASQHVLRQRAVQRACRCGTPISVTPQNQVTIGKCVRGHSRAAHQTKKARCGFCD